MTDVLVFAIVSGPKKPQRYRGRTCLLIQVEISGGQPNLLGLSEGASIQFWM